MSTKSVRIGNAGGYWGDDPEALRRQLEPGNLDYITQDFLAEITMSILQKQRRKNPELGYARDFVDQIRECLPLLGQTHTRIISNAGGINPTSCAREIDRHAGQAGLRLDIAVVQGDDLMDRLDQLADSPDGLRNMETHEEFAAIQDRVLSANAYLGAAPVVEALALGARIVVTGRVTDTGITAAPPVHEFGWKLTDWHQLASAVVAGHIIECGAQASGGNLTDWEEIPSFQQMAFPIVEIFADGRLRITKHPLLGGRVNRKTVTSQLIYEMGDPKSYITPDVVADFSSFRLRESSPDEVWIDQVRGRPKTDFLKVSISYQAGYKAHGTLLVSGPEAVRKGRRIADLFWKRLNLSLEETATELVGYNASHGHLARPTDPAEILLRLSVRDPDRHKIDRFAKCFASLILSSLPGVAIVGARPRVQDVVAYWPSLIPADQVEPEVTLLGTDLRRQVSVPSSVPLAPVKSNDSAPSRRSAPKGKLTRTALKQVCYARSGDKGDTANIGVVARTPEIYHWMVDYLTAERIKQYFGPICRGTVERHEVANLLAVNFLLESSLGGGGTVSLRIDPQGKTLAEALLMMQVEIPQDLVPQ